MGMGAHAHAQTNPPEISWEDWLDMEAEVFFLYARQQTRTESDAKDVLQEALTEVWRKSCGALPDKALVFATIRRRAIDLGRSMTRRSQREYRYISDDVSWFTTDYSTADTQKALADCHQGAA